jgi:hypothetical protein
MLDFEGNETPRTRLQISYDIFTLFPPFRLTVSHYESPLYQAVLLLLLLFTAIEFSVGGSSAYTSPKKQIRINIHKRNNTKIQYKRYRTQ